MLDKLLPGVDRNLALKLMCFHTFIIALSNWLVTFKFLLVGHPIPYAAFTFPLVVVATDLTVRMLGKEMGRAVVALSFIPAIIVSILVVMASGAPDSVAYRIGTSSGLAYLCSTLLDVYVFQYFRERFKSWWIAPTLSSIVANILDTYTFFGAAFYNSEDAFMAANWPEVATNQIIAKIIVSLLVVLPSYGILLNYIQRKLVVSR